MWNNNNQQQPPSGYPGAPPAFVPFQSSNCISLRSMSASPGFPASRTPVALLLPKGHLPGEVTPRATHHLTDHRPEPLHLATAPSQVVLRSFGFPSPSGPPPGGYHPPPSGPPPQASRGYPGASYHQNNYGPPQGAPPPPPRPAHGGYQPSYQAPPMPPSSVQSYGPHFQSGGRDMQPHFQYSQCTGKKRALLIGINYFGQNGELRGCINDVKNVKAFLMEHWGYKQDDMVILTDDASNPRMQPTTANIIQAMQWLVNNAKPNDALFFHYSGHGGQTKDTDGDEADGYDEVIYPVDFESSGHIVDDMMHDIMVKPLPEGCRLTAIFDYSTEGKIKEPNLAAEAGQGLLSAVTSYARGDMGGVFKSAMGLVKTATGSTSKADKISKATRTSPADVISFSGCKDSQTSADTQEAGQATGAMSFAFISALTSKHQQSYQELLNGVRDILRSKYSQKPQLSSSHPMDTNIMFIC
ncbi:hypothetical protein MD484_g3828, partial [Candolleomyces efflorescens]